jgi:hypothetical protein
MNGCEIFTACVPSPRGLMFLSLIEKAFGSDETTRTWKTIWCVAAAG